MRCSILGLALSAALLGAATASNGTAAATATAPDLTVLHGWRAYTGGDGETHFEPMRLQGTPMAEFNSKDAVMRLFAADASVILIAGKPGFESARHNVGHGHREILLVVQGAATALYGHGRTHVFKAGDLTLFEDHDSKGRAVRFGTDGYVALTVPLAD